METKPKIKEEDKDADAEEDKDTCRYGREDKEKKTW